MVFGSNVCCQKDAIVSLSHKLSQTMTLKFDKWTDELVICSELEGLRKIKRQHLACLHSICADLSDPLRGDF